MECDEGRLTTECCFWVKFVKTSLLRCLLRRSELGSSMAVKASVWSKYRLLMSSLLCETGVFFVVRHRCLLCGQTQVSSLWSDTGVFFVVRYRCLLCGQIQVSSVWSDTAVFVVVKASRFQGHRMTVFTTVLRLGRPARPT